MNSSLKAFETLLHFFDASNPCNQCIAGDIPMIEQMDRVNFLLRETTERGDQNLS